MNVVGGSSSRRQPFGKGKKNKKKKNKKVQSHAGIVAWSQTKKRKHDQSQAECFFCKKQGHWKRNCPQYIASLDSNRQRKKQAIAGQGIYTITHCNFSICDINDWILDTDSPYHICNSL